MKNPYDKRVEREWTLGGWDEARLNRSKSRAEWFGASLRFGGFIVGLSSMLVMLAVPMEMTGGLHLLSLLGLGMSVAALGFALEIAGVRLEKRAERLSKVSEGDDPAKALMRIQLALADSPRAKEWRDEAEWGGRELRMFDVEAMEALAQIEGSALAEREGDAHWAKGMKQRAIRSNGVSNERMTGGQNGD